MNAKGGKKAPKKKTNTHQMAEPFKKDEILTDIKKKQWIIGNSIGIGGFGEIYEAASYSGKIPKNYPAVIKIEPHGNGPLFVEMHFYMRNVNPDEIEAWRKKNKLSNLGMPKFLGSGSHEYNGTKYRFLVVERYGTDLWKLFIENKRSFPEHTVYNVALQVIDVLKYIHHKKYVHGDIKGGNLLLDLNSQNNIYLVDFGLATHYTTKNEYKPDPKKAHDGTPEYTSRDAHNGVPTMRGDMEILGYNIIQWLCGNLPWDDLKDSLKLQKQKEEAFKDITAFLTKCFKNEVPDTVMDFIQLVDTMEFHEAPNYDKFKDILIKGLKRLKQEPYGKLEFKSSEKHKSKKNNASSEIINKTLRVNLIHLPAKKQAKLDESVNTLVDAKFETGAAVINHLLNNVDFESESEYDVQIKKRKKKNSTVEKDTRVNKVTSRTKKIEQSSDDEVNVPMKSRNRPKKDVKGLKKDVKAPKKDVKGPKETEVKRTPKRNARGNPKYVNESDEDMFQD